MSGSGGHGRKRGGHSEHEEEGGSERWLVTYADMLTLLLVLFIVLYSISKVNTSKLSQLRASLNAALGGGQNSVLDGSTGLGNQEGDTIAAQLIPNPGAAQQNNGLPQVPSQSVASSITSIQTNGSTSSPVNDSSSSTDAVKAEVNEFQQIEKNIATALAAKGLSDKAQYTVDERGLVVTLVTDDLVFGPNSATLLSGGQTILAAVTPPLVGITNKIEVDGFTNQLNTSTAPYPSGWELSSAHASSVAEYLISQNIAANRLKASGYSDQDPLYPPSDPRSVTGNRRVEIVVLSNLSATQAAQLPAASGTQP